MEYSYQFWNLSFKLKTRFLCVWGLVLLCFSLSAFAQTGIKQVDRIIGSGQAPEGIVFEIVSRDADRLKNLLPSVQGAVKALRARFPDLDMTVVTHGQEQFALMKNKQKIQSETHQRVKSLLANDVQLHVCGTFANMKGVEAEAFPDYVDVAAHGPELINDYIALGYQRISVK